MRTRIASYLGIEELPEGFIPKQTKLIKSESTEGFFYSLHHSQPELLILDASCTDKLRKLLVMIRGIPEYEYTPVVLVSDKFTKEIRELAKRYHCVDMLKLSESALEAGSRLCQYCDIGFINKTAVELVRKTDSLCW